MCIVCKTYSLVVVQLSSPCITIFSGMLLSSPIPLKQMDLSLILLFCSMVCKTASDHHHFVECYHECYKYDDGLHVKLHSTTYHTKAFFHPTSWTGSTFICLLVMRLWMIVSHRKNFIHLWPVFWLVLFQKRMMATQLETSCLGALERGAILYNVQDELLVISEIVAASLPFSGSR